MGNRVAWAYGRLNVLAALAWLLAACVSPSLSPTPYHTATPHPPSPTATPPSPTPAPQPLPAATFLPWPSTSTARPVSEWTNRIISTRKVTRLVGFDTFSKQREAAWGRSAPVQPH